jgi:hypothetical protein
MSESELVVAHAVRLALVALLFAMLWRGRVRQCWTFGAYVALVLVGNTLVTFWPQRFLTPEFWFLKQAVYDLLKLAIALELLYRTLRAFPGTWRVARLVVLAFLSVSAFVLAALTPRSSVWTMWEWQPSVVTATIWLLTAVALLVVWYRVPVPDWPRVIMLGLAPYLLVFLTLIDVVRRHGWRIGAQAGVIDSLVYLALILFWTRAAWLQPGLRTAAGGPERPA